MIAVDTNLLVYAHRVDSPFHDRALPLIEGLAGGRRAWAIPWPCAHEFLAVVSNPRIYRTPTPADVAVGQMRALAATASVVLLAEIEGHLVRLAELAGAARLSGAAFHDARIAAICLTHGVTELWSADRDFSRYPQLAVRNPLLA